MQNMQMSQGKQVDGTNQDSKLSKEDNEDKNEHEEYQANPYKLTELNKEIYRNKIRTEYYPFENDQLKELVQQIDMYIQLLYQVLLSDDGTSHTKGSINLNSNQQK